MHGVCVLAVMTVGVAAPAYGDDVNRLPVIDAGLVFAVPYVVFLIALGTCQSHLSDDHLPR